MTEPSGESAAVLLHREVVHRGRVIELELHRVRLPNGEEVELQVARHVGAAAVIPLAEDGTVTLVRQLRYAADNSYLYEIPAGTLEPGETPEACAHRELEEEVGLVAGRLEPLGSILTTPGFCDERIHLFLATELGLGSLQREHDEIMTSAPVAFDEALAMVDRGEIVDGKTVCALLKTALRLSRAPR